MATRTQVQNLTRRIESLVASRRKLHNAVILVGVGETEEDAMERHYRDHPEDRNADHTIVVLFGRHAHEGAMEA